MDFMEMLNTAHSSGKAYAVAVITQTEGTTTRHTGTKMIIYADGTLAGTIGGGEIEQFVIADAKDCLISGQPVLKRYPVIQTDGKESGSEMIYIEPAFPQSGLVICGAGHVAGKLIPLAKSIGFHVSVIDIRDDHPVRERAALADEFILAGSWKDGLEQIPDNDNNYLIACAFNFKQDEEILYHLVRRKSAYIGMLASRYKRETIYNELKNRGVREEQLQHVHSPIGLQIGAETPEEIALAIAAELLSVRSSQQAAKS